MTTQSTRSFGFAEEGASVGGRNAAIVGDSEGFAGEATTTAFVASVANCGAASSPLSRLVGDLIKRRESKMKLQTSANHGARLNDHLGLFTIFTGENSNFTFSGESGKHKLKLSEQEGDDSRRGQIPQTTNGLEDPSATTGFLSC